MLLALAGVSSVAMAQQKTEVVEEFGVIQVQDKYQVITNPFWSNWFFSIGGGAEAVAGGKTRGKDAVLSKFTVVFGIIFAVLCLVLGRYMNTF